MSEMLWSGAEESNLKTKPKACQDGFVKGNDAGTVSVRCPADEFQSRCCTHPSA